jgi:gluconolactonase
MRRPRRASNRCTLPAVVAAGSLVVAGLAVVVARTASRAGRPGVAPLGAARGRDAVGTVGTVGGVERLDPAIDALVPPGARIEQLAEGFAWTEGPVWRQGDAGQDGARDTGAGDDGAGYLLFTDIPRNTIYRWREGEGVSVFLRPAGFTGPDPPGHELGANGLTLDPQGALVMADHGNRQVARLDERRYLKETLADRFDGRRLNSPNDLIFAPHGDLYFTDPPYGLAGQDDDPAKELPFNGVYRRAPDGSLALVTRELTRPNGLALSPDGRALYVANSDAARAVWMAYDVATDGSVPGAPDARGRVLFDATPLVRQGRAGLPDGLRVADDGTLFATGPGGVLVLTPDGRHLGTIVTGQPTSNCAFGDRDRRTLYITANDRLLRVRLAVRGSGF